MLDQRSISYWISHLKAGEAEAAQRIWDYYSKRLINLAQQKLGNLPKRVADEEDITQSVFQSVCKAAEAGRLVDVKNRDELWWLLLSITKRKVVDHIRHEMAQKRGSGRVRSESCFRETGSKQQVFTLDDLLGNDPTPDFLVSLEEENQRLLGRLRDDKLRKIAVSRLEGYTVGEIAGDLAVSTRSIERKLQLIRSTWSEELASVD